MSDFKPVRAIQDGGTGVPMPTYLLTHRGEPLAAFAKGEARAALGALDGRPPEFAVVACVDGEQRVVARGRTT